MTLAMLAKSNLESFGKDPKRVYPIDETPCFTDLLRAIDQAGREHRREEDRQEALRRMQRGSSLATS